MFCLFLLHINDLESDKATILSLAPQRSTSRALVRYFKVFVFFSYKTEVIVIFMYHIYILYIEKLKNRKHSNPIRELNIPENTLNVKPQHNAIMTNQIKSVEKL